MRNDTVAMDRMVRSLVAVLISTATATTLAACQSAAESPTAASATEFPASATDFSASAAPAPPPWTRLDPTNPVTIPFSGVGNQYVFDVTAYGAGFVGVGEDLQFGGPVNGRIWTSADGTAWSRLGVVENDLADAEVDLVASSGVRLVAIGSERHGEAAPADTKRIVWKSDDASTWRRVGDVSLFRDASIAGVVGGSSGFIAWGNEGRNAAVFSSVDGVAWDRAPAPTSFRDAVIYSVAAYRGGFVAVGAHEPATLTIGGPNKTTAVAWWSPDGSAWITGGTDAGPGLGSLEVGARGLLAHGGNECGGCVGPSILWRSTDGHQWSRVGDDLMPPPEYASDGSRIVRFDWQATGAVSTSADGDTWLPAGKPGAVDLYGLSVGAAGILVLKSIPKGGPPDEVDGEVWYLVASKG
jgi:hypothetical protein